MDPFTIIGWVAIAIVAITTHEAAHAYVADRLGDPTARMLGRVTLNPVPHIDPFMTIILPGLLILSGSGFIFGGAKPVPVNVGRLRRPMRDYAIVAAAGPGSNLAMALLWAGMLSAVLHLGIWTEESVGVSILQFGIFINVLLMVFNLMPIPPLDGSRLVMYLLRGEARIAYMNLERVGIFILLGLLFFVPAFRVALWSGISWVGYAVGTVVGLPLPWYPAALTG
jgi:Zn-dependent protease